MPRVSVFMPSYNHASYVAAAIRSVQEQSFQDFEIVVTDDGSTDGTPDVIARLDEPRLRLHRFATNRGAVSATNDAIRRSRGDYLALLNSDDVFLPQKLERQVTFLDANPRVGAVFGLTHAIDNNGAHVDQGASFNGRVFEVENRSQTEWLRHFFFTGNCLCHPTMMIRRACYESVGLYDGRFAILPDFQMWMRLLAAYPIHILPEPLIGFRELANRGNASAITDLNSYVRLAWEHVHVRRCYVDLRPEMFDAAFAPEIAALELPPTRDRRLILGQICLGVENPTLHRLGLELMFDALPADPPEDGAPVGFGHADYLRETGARDVFNMCNEFRINDLDQQLREERQRRPAVIEEVRAPMAWSVPPAEKLKLNLGCGPNILPEWLNLDLEPKAGAHFWNATEPMPFEAESVSIVYSEHFIEHLALADVMRLLRECHRVLCPGGMLRLSTPNIEVLIEAYVGGRLGEWRNVGWLPGTPCDMMNEGMRSWGHQYVFDQAQLTECLHQAGFAVVAPAPWRQSSVEALLGLECRPFHGELILEAQK